MSELTAADVRAAYPTPTTCHTAHRDCYCIGGALVKAAFPLTRHLFNFPTRFTIVSALVWANPALDRGTASNFAYRMVRANEASDFEDAWAILDAALRFGKGELA